MAHRTFRWTSEASGGAAVHCVIVGFTKDSATQALLIEHGVESVSERATKVPTINAYLVDGRDTLVRRRLYEVGSELH